MRHTSLLQQFEKLFSVTLITGFALVGCALVIAIPPFQIADESTHWNTALNHVEAIGLQKDNLSAWRTLPLFFDVNRIKHKPNEKLPRSRFSELPLMQPQTTALQSIGYSNFSTYPNVWIATTLSYLFPWDTNSKGLSVFYLARLLAGLMVLLPLFRLASLATPSRNTGAIAILGFVMCPIFIQQSFAVSSDVVCNAATLWAMVVLINREQLTKWDWILATLFSFIACSTKPVMIIIVISAWACYWIEKKRAANQKIGGSQKWARAGVVVLTCFTVTTWNIFLYFQKMPATQNLYLFQNFTSALSAVGIGIADRIRHFPILLNMGWLETQLSSQTSLLWLLIFAFAVAVEIATAQIPLSKASWLHDKRKALTASILAGGALGYALTVSLLMQILFHKRPEPFFNFLQPRYFFPTAILLITAGLILVCNGKKKMEPQSEGLASAMLDIPVSFGISTLLLLVTIYAVRLIGDVSHRYWF